VNDLAEDQFSQVVRVSYEIQEAVGHGKNRPSSRYSIGEIKAGQANENVALPITDY